MSSSSSSSPPAKSIALAFSTQIHRLPSQSSDHPLSFTKSYSHPNVDIRLCIALCWDCLFQIYWLVLHFSVVRGLFLRIVPRRGLGMAEQPIYGAVGTDASCNMAGFFSQFQVAIPLFNATLGTYFLLTVYYGWNEQRIKRVEWLFYVLPLGYALFTATYAVAADLIGHVEWSCWILP